MPVQTQEIRQTTLQLGRKRAVAVLLGQALRRSLTQDSRAGRVRTCLPGERPERQVHLRRRVVREGAHRHPSFVVGSEVSEKLAGERVGGEAGGEDRGDLGEYL